MNRKDCKNCKYATNSWTRAPCLDCTGHSNWTLGEDKVDFKQAYVENKFPWTQDIFNALKAGHTVYVKNNKHDWQAVNKNMLGVDWLFNDMLDGQWRLHKPIEPLVHRTHIDLEDKSISINCPPEYRGKPVKITIEVVE